MKALPTQMKTAEAQPGSRVVALLLFLSVIALAVLFALKSFTPDNVLGVAGGGDAFLGNTPSSVVQVVEAPARTYAYIPPPYTGTVNLP